jgi:hypothetical protein
MLQLGGECNARRTTIARLAETGEALPLASASRSV